MGARWNRFLIRYVMLRYIAYWCILSMCACSTLLTCGYWIGDCIRVLKTVCVLYAWRLVTHQRNAFMASHTKSKKWTIIFDDVSIVNEYDPTKSFQLLGAHCYHTSHGPFISGLCSSRGSCQEIRPEPEGLNIEFWVHELWVNHKVSG